MSDFPTAMPPLPPLITGDPGRRFAFNEPFRWRLAENAAADWAIFLREGQLSNLLWALGEFSIRSYPLWERFPTRDDPSNPDAAQVRHGLRAICVPSVVDSDPRPAFRDDFRAGIALGKYSRWATHLSAGGLFDVLRGLGEFAADAGPVLEWLDAHRNEFFVGVSYDRLRHGLIEAAWLVRNQRLRPCRR